MALATKAYFFCKIIAKKFFIVISFTIFAVSIYY